MSADDFLGFCLVVIKCGKEYLHIKHGLDKSGALFAELQCLCCSSCIINHLAKMLCLRFYLVAQYRYCLNMVI